MDPVSIVAIVNSSLGLALKCGTVAKEIHSLASKWKQAELSALELVNDCRMLETALKRIESMTKNSHLDEDVLQQLQSSLDLGARVISALEEDLETVIRVQQGPGFRKKSKIMWNEGIISDHQSRVTRQLTAMTCLLKLMELPSLSTQRETLVEKVEVFRKAESSAWTIVNSRASTSIRDDDSIMTMESKELEYKRLSFENLLFTATVYKRSFRTKAMAQLFKRERDSRTQLKRNNLDVQLNADNESAITSFQAVVFADTTSVLEFGQDPIGDVRTSDPPINDPSESPLVAPVGAKSTFEVGLEDSMSDLRTSSPPIYDPSDLSWETSETRQTRLDTLLIDLVDGYRPNPVSTRDISFSAIDLENAFLHLRDGIRPSNAALSKLVSINKCVIFDILDAGLQSSIMKPILDQDAVANLERTFSTWRQEFFIKACNEDNLELAKKMLERKADVDCWSSSDMYQSAKRQPIHIAVLNRNLALVRLLIVYGAHLENPFTFPNGPGGIRRRPLHHAVNYRMSRIVSLLLEYGAAPSATDEEGEQPLHIACRNGFIEIIERLINAGASVTAPGKDGFQPLHALVTAEDIQEHIINSLIDLLLTNGADVNATATDSKRTPLLIACDWGRVGVAKHLLSAGAKPEAKWFWASPPFVSALQRGQADSLEEFRAAGTEIFAKDAKTLSTSLHRVAAQSGDARAEIMSARLLIYWGVDIQARDQKGRTALHLAAMRPEASSLMKLLIDKGSDVNAVDHEGMSAFHIAAKERLLFNMETLVKQGAEVRIKNRQGRQALHTIVGDADRTDPYLDDRWLAIAVDFLIRHGGDINAIDDHGHSLLYIAASNCNLITVNVLLSRGARVLPILKGNNPFEALKSNHLDNHLDRFQIECALNQAIAMKEERIKEF